MIALRYILPLLLSASLVQAQPNHNITDPERDFKTAKQYFIQQQYGLAYPILSELATYAQSNPSGAYMYQQDDVRYYWIVTRLKLQIPAAEAEALQYSQWVNNDPRQQLMHFHLAQYYFTQSKYPEALKYYELAGLDNLSNEEIADAKFERGYAYFVQQRFREASPLFQELTQLPEHRYYIPANYYYGFIAYYNRQFPEAMKSFRLVESDPAYSAIVPYYIAEILYFSQQKEEAKRYGESVLSRGGLYYDKEMNLLLGQIYYEQRQFNRALPLLDYYVTRSNKVSREVLYAWSYCQYDASQWNKAIEGFKQLSNEKDSLGQNSMYLLGDAYLRVGQKANARNAFQFCAFNSSNPTQQEVSRFTYAKLSYELGYPDIALTEFRSFLQAYPQSKYVAEARELQVALLAGSNNFAEALNLYQSTAKPSANLQRLYPKILYGRAVELFNDQQASSADTLFTRLLQQPASSYTPYAQFWKGELAYRAVDYDAAIRFLSAYQQSNAPALGEATPTTARYNLGYAYLKKENYKQAAAQFEPIARSQASATPLEQDAYIRWADALFMQKDFARAGAMYQTAINNALPASDYALYQQAMIAGIRSATQKISLLQQVQRQYPNSKLLTDAQMEIAATYMADEKFTEAISVLLELSKGKDVSVRPQALQKLALCYTNIGRTKDALATYDLLYQQFAQSAEAAESQEAIRNLFVQEGRPEAYEAMMQQYGRPIAASEAEQLLYEVAERKFVAKDWTGAQQAFANYLTRFPNGARAIAAEFFRGEALYSLKQFPAALTAYQSVHQKGVSVYYERATLYAARILYFEQKQYASAIPYYVALRAAASTQETQLEALRGLVRCYHQARQFEQANDAAAALLQQKGISTDDRTISFLVLGKSQQQNRDYTNAIASFKQAASLNKAAWGAEARYELAASQLAAGNVSAVEKAALAVIRETGSYDLWVTKAYILIGDALLQQKDYFNAKATYQSVAERAAIEELREEARQKLEAAIEAEKSTLKIN